MKILFLVGIILHAWMNGRTEIYHYWHHEEGALSDGKYHLYRKLEIFGILLMIIASYFMPIDLKFLFGCYFLWIPVYEIPMTVCAGRSLWEKKGIMYTIDLIFTEITVDHLGKWRYYLELCIGIALIIWSYC